MHDLEFAYCNECEDLVEYDVFEEEVSEEYKGQKVAFTFAIGRCKCCGAEVSTDLEYNARRAEEKIRAYKKAKGIIDVEEITEILEKYNVGKESLAKIAGFGTVTIKRYYDGVIPAKEYSDVLIDFLNDEEIFIEATHRNKSKLTAVAYHKILERYHRLQEIKDSKTDQVVNYILANLGEVTPLALEKLLAFSNGVNYAMNGNQLMADECQAWQHGPVYPVVYARYKSYGYKPIDSGIKSNHGCMLSKLSTDEMKAIDLTICTFGLYSPRTLEMVSHTQMPWKEKRIGYNHDESGREVIDETSVKEFYTKRHLDCEKNIIEYIQICMKEARGEAVS
ncbi:MAG: DUF4065 domain-containing protein [Lachnospiraceae bacterium]